MTARFPTVHFDSSDPVATRAAIERNVDWAIDRIRADERAELLARGFMPAEIDRAMNFHNVQLEQWRSDMINDLWGQAVRFFSAPGAPSQAVN